MEMTNEFCAGNKGEKIRSDCFVSLELKEEGVIEIGLSSKVESNYGKHIRLLCLEILDYFKIRHAILNIEDSGALDFVIAARLEAVIKQAIITDKEFLLKFIPENELVTTKNRHRVTRLYLPGNTPSLMLNSGIHKPDGVILDLEDAVAFSKKQEARFLVRNALRSLNFLGVERMVRINQFPEGLKDLPYIIPHNVNLVLIPKCEDEVQIKTISSHIDKIQKKSESINPVWLMPIIESAKGILNIIEIAKSSDMIVAIAIGLEDYTADLGVKRTPLGLESLFARTKIVTTCKAFGIQPIDSVFSDVENLEGLKENVLASKSIGFEGMGCIHPRQIEIISKHFAPTDDEIEEAKTIVFAYNDAIKNGLGVISLGTKMIDAPVVEKSKNIIKQAISSQRLDENWTD
ncbi:aldolase/citrate lyase family protein [Gelidibacter salicanalis]|uniref:HpcH/HpaI aldolase/citrate lyase family protein n=1 Tax=Gelidibacter salicanalis TaxID=291193 RepID=A0A934NKR4_9FLAO|nr:aldolase/citrate lyase family protein [Gelidibacter salicanalis]MBJ7881957.1 HpcH/HpaI aldolase/citrate lyase family protein [Gelidibacter salicanalis]